MPIEMNDIEKNRLAYAKEAQEMHTQKFIKKVTAIYNDLIKLATKEKDFERVEHVKSLLSRLSQGDLTVASKKVFITQGSKLYYCEKDMRVKQEVLSYTR